MKKTTVIVLALVLVMSILAGCAGTPVIYYTECDCPEGTHTSPDTTPAPDTGADDTEPEDTDAPVLTEGALKTGLAIVGSASGSVNGGNLTGLGKQRDLRAGAQSGISLNIIHPLGRVGSIQKGRGR